MAEPKNEFAIEDEALETVNGGFDVVTYTYY